MVDLTVGLENIGMATETMGWPDEWYNALKGRFSTFDRR